jgi:hypothetical protein
VRDQIALDRLEHRTTAGEKAALDHRLDDNRCERPEHGGLVSAHQLRFELRCASGSIAARPLDLRDDQLAAAVAARDQGVGVDEARAIVAGIREHGIE